MEADAEWYWGRAFRRGRTDRQLTWVISIVAIGMSALGFSLHARAASGSGKPRIEVTRWLEPAGRESYLLECRFDDTKTDEYVCRLSHRLRGEEVRGKWLYAKKVRPWLKNVLNQAPRRPPAPVPRGEEVLMSWEIDANGRKLRGDARPLGKARDPWSEFVLDLEAQLAAPLFE
jgi:hypothetical protein